MNCLEDHIFPEVPGGVYFHLIHGAVDVAMILVIISCNSLIATAILRYNRKRRSKGTHTPSHSASLRLVLSLATSDILVGLTNIYFLSFDYSCVVYTTLGARQTPCVLRYAIFMTTSSTSTFSLVVLAVDRYVAVAHALRYRDIMTTRLANLLIFVAWLLGSLNGFSLLLWNNWTPTTPCIDFGIVPFHYITVLCSITSVTTATLLFVLHWGVHRRALASTNLVRSMSVAGAQFPKDSPMKSKSARTMFLVLGCVFTLWTPLTAVVILRSREVDSPHLDVAYRLSVSLYNLGYFVNTFVYSWKNTTIRTAILGLFARLRKRRGSSVSERSVTSRNSSSDHRHVTLSRGLTSGLDYK